MILKKFHAFFPMLVALLLLGNVVLAGPADKQNICHFDAASGLFKVISVSQNAVAQHTAQHGDVLTGTFYADADGDGFGAGATSACPNSGFVAAGGDAFPNDPNEHADTDGDGVGDNGDAFPSDPSETADSDGDGIGDNADACPAQAGGVNGCPGPQLASDILVANNIYWDHRNGVAVLKNDGAGNFTGQNYHTRLGVNAIRAADFNGDGFDDFVTASYDNNEVWIGLNNGSGSFSTYDTGVRAGASAKIAIGDFNNDGNADVAIAQNSGMVTIALGNGAGGLTTASALATGGSTRSIAVGDLDGDGKLDYANIAHVGNHYVGVNYGDGAGGRSSQLFIDSGNVSLGVAIGDVDGDGRPDLVTGGHAGPRGPIAVYLNDGTADLAPRVLYGALNTQVYVHRLEDMDADGDLDIVATGNDGQWFVAVYDNNGAGQFNSAPAVFHTLGGEISDVAVGDANKDGVKDIISTNYTGHSIDVLPGNGIGGFGAIYRVTSPTMLRTVGVAVGKFQ